MNRKQRDTKVHTLKPINFGRKMTPHKKILDTFHEFFHCTKMTYVQVLINHVQLKRNNIDAPKVFNKGNSSESSFKNADEKKMYLNQLKNIVTDISNE